MVNVRTVLQKRRDERKQSLSELGTVLCALTCSAIVPCFHGNVRFFPQVNVEFYECQTRTV